jgi:23S rRNA (uracil1939-C5)-methyltransferase
VVRFTRMGPDGEAIANVSGRDLAVPYAAPGDEARVRVQSVRRGQARGQLIALRVASPRVVHPRCPHFGRCGGCQWQHLEYRAQLEQKAALVRAALGRTGVPPHLISPAIGWEPPWEFRTHLEAAVGTRETKAVLGFSSWGGDRIIEIQQCPVQHPGNVSALHGLREAWESLHPLAGVLRGLLSRAGAATGEVLAGVSAVRRLSPVERRLVVRALLDRIPHLVGLMEVRAPRGHLLAGRRSDLLWGRPYVAEEVAGVRFHIPLLAEFPVNALSLPGVIELVLAELDASSADTVVEPDAGIGAYTCHLALAAGRVVAVTEVAQLDAAWANARLNRLTNCAFYTRDPARALGKLAGAHLAFLHPPGGGIAPGLLRALRAAGVRRVVYLGRALRALERDVAALERDGYRVLAVRPIDLSPHTSRVHALVTASAA